MGSVERGEQMWLSTISCRIARALGVPRFELLKGVTRYEVSYGGKARGGALAWGQYRGQQVLVVGPSYSNPSVVSAA